MLQNAFALYVKEEADRIVTELEELPIHFSEGHWGEYIDKDDAIGIVRKGGAEC